MSSRRLLALLCAAVLGVLLCLGLAATALFGAAGAIASGVVALVLVVVGSVRGRRVLAPPTRPASQRPAGRTCDCCTTTHFDDVKVI